MHTALLIPENCLSLPRRSQIGPDEKASRLPAILDYDVGRRQPEGQMVTIVDLKTELGKLSMLKGRRPDMTEADREGTNAFVTLTPFRDGNIFSAKFAGNGAWERH